MAKKDYSGPQKTAIRLIEKYGDVLTLTNPDNDITKAIGVFQELQKNDRPNSNTAKHVMNILIEPSKKILKRRPEVGDYADRFKGANIERWIIVEVVDIQPGDTIILYKVRVER